jgi:hypothetical protein
MAHRRLCIPALCAGPWCGACSAGAASALAVAYPIAFPGASSTVGVSGASQVPGAVLASVTCAGTGALCAARVFPVTPADRTADSFDVSDADDVTDFIRVGRALALAFRSSTGKRTVPRTA